MTRYMVSIHAPNEGSDVAQLTSFREGEFQSTLPMKGATRQSWHINVIIGFQSTLPMKGATRRFLFYLLVFQVSIHAPNEGSDPAWRARTRGFLFQSTLPMKGATRSSESRCGE